MSGNPWALWLHRYDTVPYQLSRKEGWDAFVNAGSRPSFEVLSRSQMHALNAEALADYNEARCVWNANPATIKTQQLARSFDVLDQVMAC